jgi:RNA polymerase sigma-70 factor (ECF subfamily)
MFMMFLSAASIDEKNKFEFVYARWKNLMLNKANGILHDYSLAEDAVSEAFIRVYKNLHKLDDLESGKTAAFLVMIVKNVSLTMLSKQTRTVVTDTAEYDRADAFNLEDEIISKSSAQELFKLIDNLKDELKTPFLLKYAYDFSLKEIGKMLKITENNATVRVHRAKIKLSEMLKKGGARNEN